MSFKLPSCFTDGNKNKIVKVYGCSFNFLDSDNKNPTLSNRYQNQFISVHSNIAHEDTNPLNSDYLLEDGRIGYNPTEIKDELKLISDFMMIANNYYTPKIFDLTNTNLNEIIISFRDAYGELIPIRSSYSGADDFLEEIEQVVFKIEIELAILE
jgi:hypothetical protein